MSGAGSQAVVAPFDGVADDYDDVFTGSKIGQAQRSAVWKELGNTFHSGDRVLEIGCGTGVDACFLAEHGVNVVACDISPRMIAVARRRFASHPCAALVEPLVLAAEEIDTLRGGDLFDGAFSNFGALNCVREMRSLAIAMATLLRPGAQALLCLMGPSCLWEIVSYLAKANPAKAFRRFNRGGSTARLSQGGSVHVYYPSLRSLSRAFSPEFSLESVKGIGVTVPPSYMESAVGKFPGLLLTAVSADSFLAHCPGIRLLADHILIRFKRREVTVDRVAE
jgi:ubiquinone/menaquinone biosynthesis C-methylase UbiE